MKTLSSEYQRDFENLLENVGTKLSRDAPTLTAFWPMCGKDFDGDLMVVGRAVSGWPGQFQKPDLADPNKRRKILDYARQISERGLRPPYDRCPMLWLRDQWGSSIIARDISKSHFWQIVRHIALLDKLLSQTQYWSSTICWSDLYKIAPLDRENPKGKLKQVQLEASIKLLNREVEEFNAKRILVLTGGRTSTEEWFDPFAQKMSLDLHPVQSRVVEGVANKDGRRWVVTRSPVIFPSGVDVASFAEEIREAFARAG